VARGLVHAAGQSRSRCFPRGLAGGAGDENSTHTAEFITPTGAKYHFTAAALPGVTLTIYTLHNRTGPYARSRALWPSLWWPLSLLANVDSCRRREEVDISHHSAYRGSNTMGRKARVISSILLSAAALTACGGGNQSSPTTASAPSPAQSSVAAMPSAPASSPPGAPVNGPQIVISTFAYTVPGSVSPGQQLTIVNKDETNHTVTADENNLFDIRVSGGGGTMSFTVPTTPGTYPFHCRYHADMHGVLTVQ
jgi:plastocyanin